MPDASAHRCPTTPGSGGPRTLAGAVPGCFDQHMSNDALTLIREESDRLATVLTATDPDRHVPSCPAWTAADLLWHLTEVHELWGAILATGALTDERAGAGEEQLAPRPADVAQLCERRAAATGLLLGQRARRSDDEPSWFWLAAERTVGIIRRMQTPEATIQRVDAELAAEAPVTRIAPSVALAGLQHMIEVMWPPSSTGSPTGPRPPRSRGRTSPRTAKSRSLC